MSTKAHPKQPANGHKGHDGAYDALDYIAAATAFRVLGCKKATACGPYSDDDQNHRYQVENHACLLGAMPVMRVEVVQ